MARPRILIDIRGAQSILDEIKPGQFSNEDSLCKFVANEYNRKVGTPNINGQLIKLRLKSDDPDIKLTLNFPIPRGRRGRQLGEKLSPEHKAKLIEGRQNKKNNFSVQPSNQRAAEELRKHWTRTRTNENGNVEEYVKYSKLVEGAIRGNKLACIKLHCIGCMGDDSHVRESIRNCTSFICGTYAVRPFQRDNAEKDNG